ncbi:MAG: hypothetical protein AB7N24_01245 [Dehalococcoidia bacterium]
MNWQDDPMLARERYHSGVRNRLLRSLVIWGPLFLAAAAGLIFFTIDRAFLGGDHGGTWFLVVVLAILTTLFGFQSIQSLLDLIGEPEKLTGTVTRRWARSDSFVIKTHYIRVGKNILRGDQFVLDGIKEGDTVEATFYPKSAVLIWVEKQVPPAETEPAQP